MTQACRDRLRMDVNALKKSSHTGQLLNFFLRDDTADSRKNLLDSAKQAPIAAKEVYQHAFTCLKRACQKTV